MTNKVTDLDSYQTLATCTAVYPHESWEVFYPLMGLSGEVGEITEKLKKFVRDEGRSLFPPGGSSLPEGLVHSLKLELGDLLWYLSVMARDLGLSLQDVAQSNIDKLSSRQERGVLRGDGDDR